jgi:hypothetical protein
MEYAADDINIGYMTCLMFINSEKTLVDKLNNITELQPIDHQGGVSFDSAKVFAYLCRNNYES